METEIKDNLCGNKRYPSKTAKTLKELSTAIAESIDMLGEDAEWIGQDDGSIVVFSCSDIAGGSLFIESHVSDDEDS
jgi:hypothetical protein